MFLQGCFDPAFSPKEMQILVLVAPGRALDHEATTESITTESFKFQRAFQVSFARFYVILPAYFLLPPPSSGGSAQYSPPGPNSNLRISVFPCRTATASKCFPPDFNRKQVCSARPQPQAPDQSGPRRTSTASSGSKCSLPDINREPQSRACPAGPHHKESPIQDKVPESMSQDMPDIYQKECHEILNAEVRRWDLQLTVHT